MPLTQPPPPMTSRPDGGRNYIDLRSWWLSGQTIRDGEFNWGPTTPVGITSIKLQYETDEKGNKIWRLYNGLISEPLSTYLPITDEEKEWETVYTLPLVEWEPQEYKFFKLVNPRWKEYVLPFGAIKLVLYRLTSLIGEPKKNRFGFPYTPELRNDQLIIGGSFALGKYLEMIDDPLAKKWKYKDIDYFFLGDISANQMKVRECLLKHILPGNYTNSGWLIKYGGRGRSGVPPMDFVRTSCKTLKDFVECIDISVTGVFIVHSSILTDETVGYMKVIGEVEEMRCGGEDIAEKYYLIATPKAIEDIVEKRQTYYRSDEDPSYTRCLRRVAKYWERGFKKVVQEPKKIPFAIGGYMFDE